MFEDKDAINGQEREICVQISYVYAKHKFKDVPYSRTCQEDSGFLASIFFCFGIMRMSTCLLSQK